MNNTCRCGGKMRPHEDDSKSFTWKCDQCDQAITQKKRQARKRTPSPVDPFSLGITEFNRVLFVSDPLDGDKFVVLREGQGAEGWQYFIYFANNLDWNTYEEAPKVIRL